MAAKKIGREYDRSLGREGVGKEGGERSRKELQGFKGVRVEDDYLRPAGRSRAQGPAGRTKDVAS